MFFKLKLLKNVIANYKIFAIYKSILLNVFTKELCKLLFKLLKSSTPEYVQTLLCHKNFEYFINWIFFQKSFSLWMFVHLWDIKHALHFNFYILMVILFFQVSLSDGLPSLICRQCLHQVNTWHEFKQLCDSSQATLKEWQNSTRPAVSEHALDKVWINQGFYYY